MLSHSMKKRFDTFVDAILAIVITIMALELPQINSKNYALNNVLVAVLVYFVSFCFVGSIWYQLARTSDEVKQISKKIMLLELMMVFIISLIPNLTMAMVANATKYTVMLYGMTLLIVESLMRIVSFSTLKKRYSNTADFIRSYLDILGSFTHGTFLLNIVLLILGWFYPKIAMGFYLLIPVRSFLTIDNERVENQLITRMSYSERKIFDKLSIKQKRKLIKLMRSYRIKPAAITVKNLKTKKWQAFVKSVSNELNLDSNEIENWFLQK
ncbi:TMEM175 family protein [Lactobacillus sp. ESL0785]|uniref:TMEM175 family protein n=1 Tax=Lactobacillus sp. ESL0785 TaxID=2983232 RepID=UPI0023F8664C|nr:TMEM175 family protein [Lactobacillus sp. ESL0785]WEV70890.1 TMEM175 family protein [Lactobacillus sp. ESL0785]